MAKRRSCDFKPENISEIVDIYMLGIPDWEKSYRIYLYGFRPEELLVRLRGMSNRGETAESFELLTEICGYYAECIENGSLELGKFIHNNSNELSNLEYCERILQAFIDDNESWKKDLFFRKNEIDSTIFGFCRHTVSKFNSELYQKFMKKEKFNQMKEKSYKVVALKDIADAIETGSFKDGTEFSEIDFWRRMPFIGEFNSFESLILFVKNHLNEKAPIILKYLSDKNIDRDSFLPIDATYNSRMANRGVGNVILSCDEVSTIKEYMRENDIPLINGTYSCVKKMLYSKYCEGPKKLIKS